MKNSGVQLEDDTITIILAVPITGKSSSQYEATKAKGIKIFDTNDCYDRELKTSMTPEVRGVYYPANFQIVRNDA